MNRALLISDPVAGQEEYSLHSALTEGIFNPTTPEVAAMCLGIGH